MANNKQLSSKEKQHNIYEKIREVMAVKEKFNAEI